MYFISAGGLIPVAPLQVERLSTLHVAAVDCSVPRREDYATARAR
jgi:hypothetical protein